MIPLKNRAQVKRLNVSNHSLGKPGEYASAVRLGRIVFHPEKKGSKVSSHRVAVKFFKPKHPLTPQRVRVYESVIERLRTAGIKMPKIGFAEHEGQWVQVSGVYGSKSRTKLDIRLDSKYLQQPEHAERLLSVCLKLMNAGFPPFGDAIGVIQTSRGPLFRVYDLDALVDFEGLKPKKKSQLMGLHLTSIFQLLSSAGWDYISVMDALEPSLRNQDAKNVIAGLRAQLVRGGH
ncbi:MAG: hypothetical protein Q7S92_05460 [Candidatus Diapherotrites archaeon]|nr:hypothetical protein [Candidatus Diapherotrites archaeon]